jgi:serine/threonine protein kinase/alpha-tubulin suppressor-like RCC1 family protein
MALAEPRGAPRLQELETEYELIRELGHGGTAVVYLARDRELGREVAIKVVRPSHVDDEDTVARLTREAKLVAQLRHPNIVPLLGTRHLRDGSLALIMQYVPGRTLKETIRSAGPLPIAVVEKVLREIGMALDYAHRRHGVVHRDIKPENIYLDAEYARALLSDFGIARPSDVDSGLTLAGMALGTPAYMSPEQIDGVPLDGRSDLYSLGVVAYEMLTGRQPWAGNNLYTIIYKQKHESLPPLHIARGDMPPYLERAIDGLLHKDRERRWRDAADFLVQLRAYVARPERIAPPEPHATEAPTPQPVDEDSPTLMYRRGLETDDPTAVPGERPPPARSETVAVAPPRPTAVDGPAGEAKPRSRGRRAQLLAILALFVVLGGSAATLVTISGRQDTLSAEAVALPTTAAIGDVGATAPVDELPRVPAHIAAVAGHEQTAPAGRMLAAPIVIRVDDAEGRPVSDASVEFRIVAGDGEVWPVVARTDSYGTATAWWTMGHGAGRNELAALIGETDDAAAAVVSAIAVAAEPARIVTVAGNQQDGPRGAPLPGRIAIRVEDEHGNPVAGAPVEFRVISGDGSVDPASATTAETGTARATWTLGPGAAPNELVALVRDTELQTRFVARPRNRLSVLPSIAAGGTHSCALAGSGIAFCWGGNDNGQLGAGSAGRMAELVRIMPGAGVARITAGISHSCLLDGDGAAHCWGANGDGQLGADDRTDRATPTAVRGVERFATIVAGLSHTCALTSGGAAFCWGSGSSGQIGNGSGNPRTAPTPVAGGRAFTALTAGWRHTCALTAPGEAFCWGANRTGQIGDGTTVDRAVPTRVAGEHRFTTISAGATHSCGITADGSARCWGQNTYGQLGDGTQDDALRPVVVRAAVPLAGIATGAVHSCALARTGEAYCWGRNNFGQLGDGGTAASPTPVRVAGGLRFSSLSASGSHTCGRAVSGEDYCWGYNVEGQVGDATRTDRSRPVRVRAPAR